MQPQCWQLQCSQLSSSTNAAASFQLQEYACCTESCINRGPKLMLPLTAAKLMLPWNFKDIPAKQFQAEYHFCSVLWSRMLILWKSSLKYLSHVTSTEDASAAGSGIQSLGFACCHQIFYVLESRSEKQSLWNPVLILSVGLFISILNRKYKSR